ncbi:hypothetical protein DOJK_02070 [Patescibacteria group bacterium]|nr:hypothetical protein DOJK_02070 [Patescibacteria group bacterium]
MNKSGLLLIVCLLWQTPVFAIGIEEILIGKLVDAILFSDDENDKPKTNARNPEESPRIDNQKSRSGYQFQISWQLPDDGTYSGVLEMRGKTGIFRVTTPQGDNIEQDMTAEPTDEKIVVVGSNPRDFKTQLPSNYSPDIFILSKESGEWTITDACDERSRCASVTVLNASAL